MRWSWSGLEFRLDAHQPHRGAALRARRSADRRRTGLKLAHNLFPQANATRIVASCYLRVSATLAVMASKPKHPKMTKTYAVAVRDGPDLLLVLTIQRKNGNVYTNIPRPNLPDANPHSSYHASGLVHAKTYNRQAIPRQRQKQEGPVSKGTGLLVPSSTSFRSDAPNQCLENSNHSAGTIRRCWQLWPSCSEPLFSAGSRTPIPTGHPN